MDQEFNELDKKISDDLNENDLSNLNNRLLKNKFDLGRIKHIDYNKISKLNAYIFDLKAELDFFINICDFFRNCAYFKSDYTKEVITFIKNISI